MNKKKMYRLAKSRLDELIRRRDMLIENDIPLRHINEDIDCTIMILDEIIGGDYCSALRTISEQSRIVSVERRYSEAVRFLLDANGKYPRVIMRSRDRIILSIEQNS